jgi:1-acyl-sn-glycerol-3-phosphate acyltransferase
MHIRPNAADRTAEGVSARDAGREVPPADGRRVMPISAPRPSGWVSRKSGSVSWRAVPTFVTGVLATVAVAVLVWCRGPAPGRLGRHRPDGAVVGGGVATRRGARVAIRGCEYLTFAAPCVVVSNHQSSVDPLVALRVLPVSLRVLAMRELFRIPLFGAAMRTIGMIEVDRDSPDFRGIDQVAARDLAARHSLLAYPEGRISPDGAIGEFKDGAFIIAVASQVPVVPVAIEGTSRIWPPGRAAHPRRPGAHRRWKPAADQRPDRARRRQAAGPGPGCDLLGPPRPRHGDVSEGDTSAAVVNAPSAATGRAARPAVHAGRGGGCALGTVELARRVMAVPGGPLSRVLRSGPGPWRRPPAR